MKKLFKSISLCLVIALLFTSVVSLDTASAASKTHLKSTAITLTTGEAYTQKLISAKGKTINATSVKWSTGNKAVAKISKYGYVTTYKAGKATLKAKYKGKTYKFTVTVKNAKLRASKKTIIIGKSYTQKLYNAKNKVIDTSKLTFKSSDTSVATVSAKGYIKAKKVGTTKVTVKYKGKVYTSNITVKYAISLDKYTLNLKPNKTTKIKCYVGNSVDEIAYYINDTSVAAATWGDWYYSDDKGCWYTILTVKAKAAGKTKIKIYDTNNKKDCRYVTVNVDDGYNFKFSQSFPLDVNYESASGKVYSTATFTSCTITEKKVYSNNVDLKINIKGYLSYVANISGNDTAFFNVYVYNENGEIIDDWIFDVKFTGEGSTFNITEGFFVNADKPGKYTLKIVERN